MKLNWVHQRSTILIHPDSNFTTFAFLGHELSSSMESIFQRVIICENIVKTRQNILKPLKSATQFRAAGFFPIFLRSIFIDATQIRTSGEKKIMKIERKTDTLSGQIDAI